MQSLIDKTLLHYRILEQIGKGGMGIVYKAHDSKLKREVAIKFLPHHIATSQEERERFKIEAQAAAALNHPNIATIHAIEEVDANMFIVMEYVDGMELRNLVRANGRPALPVEQAIDIATQIAAGLEAAHRKGVVHRDIKSANVMVTGEGQVKIMDFGLAKLAGQTAITTVGTTLGTVAYMSPEQCMGNSVDHRADIWAFGVVLYEMLTGQLPFRGDVDQVVIYQILNGEPQPIAEHAYPPGLKNIIDKALTKNADERYQSAAHLRADLRNVIATGDQSTPASEIRLPQVRQSLRKRWKWLAAAGVMLLVLFWLLVRPDLRKHPAPVTDGKSLAVMYFDNRSREPDLDKIFMDMLTTNLARNQKLQVLSSQRLFDILKKLGKLEVERIDRTVATEVAENAGVNTILLGSIIQIGDKIRINAQLADVATGGIIGSELVEGDKIEDIFSMVDVLTAKLGARLGVASPVSESRLLRVADVTTSSFEAYKYYQKGRENSWRRELVAAVNNYRNAVAIDSTFALAYLYWAREGNNTIDPLVDLSHVQRILQQAEKHSAGASPKEQLLIKAYKSFYERDFLTADTLFQAFSRQYPNELEAWVIVAARYLGDADAAIAMLQRQLKIDPAFAPLYNELGYCYSQKGDHANAISSIKKYMALLPDVANAYDSAWDIYTQAGQHDEALKICEAALQQNPDWGSEIYLLIGYTNLFQGDADRAREYMRKTLQVDPSQQAWVTKNLGFSYMYEGRYREAVAEFRRSAKQASDAGQEIEALRTHLELARLLTAQGAFNEATAAIAQAKEISARAYDSAINPAQVLCHYIAGLISVRMGNHVGGESAAAAIQSFVEANDYDVYYMNYCHLLRAEMALADNRGAEALAELKNAPAMVHYYPRHHALRAQAYAMTEELALAIRTYEHFRDLIDTQLYYMGGDAFDYFLERSTIDYELARLYHRQGDRQKAIESYRAFVKQWQNADSDLHQLSDASMQLAELK